MKRKPLSHLLLIWAMLMQIVLPAVAPAIAAPEASPIPLPAGARYVATVEGISEYTLPNGLRVLLFPDDSVQNVTVNITYMVGSRHENYGETGMAHLLEHLLFKGSKNHPNIAQELTEHGAHSNATTWVDRTNYYETMESSEANLDWALRMEADRMVNSFIAKKDLDSEMSVVRNEFESGENEPSSVLLERAMETAFLWHNYGKPTIGARSDIENVPIDRLQAFYRMYYQPDNALLVVAGRFDPAPTLARIAAIFGAVPRPTRTLPRIYTQEPPQDGEREVVLRRTGDVQDVGVLYHVPPGSHPDFPALDVFVQMMADSPSGRLYKALVETRKATSVGGTTYQLHDPGIAYFMAEVRVGTPIAPAREALVSSIEEGIARSPITAEEVERAKNTILKHLELSLNNTEHVGKDLSEWQAMGDWRLLFLYRDALKKVTATDVQRVATTYFKPSNRTLALFVPTQKPDRAVMPPRPDVEKLVSDYKGQAATAAGEKFEASPENILKRLATSKVGDIKLGLLEKKTRGGMVYVSMALRFGDEKSLFGKSMVGAMTGSMLMRGTKHHTRQQLKDEFDRLKARVSVDGGPTAATVSIQTLRDNVPAVMKLVAEILREPLFDEKEFEQLRQEYIASLEQGKSDPQTLGGNELARHMTRYPKGDVRAVQTPDEEIADVKAVTLEAVKAFHRDFYGASTGEAAVVGDFDAASFPRLVSQFLGDWKSPAGYTRVPSLYQPVPAIDRALETPDKENAFYISGMELEMNSDDPDYAPMILCNYMMGGGFLNSRLATRLRQKDGLSYGAGSYFSANALDKVGQFGAYAIYAPQNAERVKKAVREELERALKDGFTEKEVEAAKVGLLQGRQIDRAKDSGLVGRLQQYLFIGRTMQWDIDFENRIKSLTPAQVVDAMRRRVDLSKLNVVMAGDFKKAASPGGK